MLIIMDYVLTLVAPPDQPILGNALASQFEELLNRSDVSHPNTNFLSVDRCFQITFGIDALQGLATEIKRLIAGKPIDHALLPAQFMRKKLLIADMDSTIIQCECLDELADFAGFGDAVSAITERAMRGELVFEDALRERVQMLAGLSVDALQQTYEQRVRTMPGAEALTKTMRAHGAITALVSGGFTFFTERVATDVGFQFNFGNSLEVKDGALTGKVLDPILGRSAKLETLERICNNHNIDLNETIAVGDGANDLSMLQRAGVGVSYKGKPVVAEGADVAIEHTDLTTLLYIQGYTDAEIQNPAN